MRLLQRSTRRLALTAEGEIYFERVQRIVGEIADAEADVMRFADQPRGRLRISVGTAFATYASGAGVARIHGPVSRRSRSISSSPSMPST